MYHSRDLANELIRYHGILHQIHELAAVDAEAIAQAHAAGEYGKVISLALALHAGLDNLIQKATPSSDL